MLTRMILIWQTVNGLAKLQPLNIYLILPIGVLCDGQEQHDLHYNTKDDSHPKALHIHIIFTPLACYQTTKR